MTTLRFLLTWGREGDGVGEFRIPIDIGINQDDEVIVTDFYNRRIQTFSPDGEPLRCFPAGQAPGGLAVAADGRCFVSHFSRMALTDELLPDRIDVFSPEGEQLYAWGRTGDGQGEFDYPGGLALGADGLVYVADQTNHRVQVFTQAGEWVRAWGSYGLEPGQFGGADIPASRVGGPNFVALDSRGRVYTTESMGCRIQRFTADGKLLGAWGDPGTGPGGFGGNFTGFPDREARLHGPVGVLVDRDDRLWVSAVNGRLQQFDESGRYLGGLDLGQGTGPGQSYAPHGLAFDSRGDLYVVDTFNHRIQKFAIDS